MSEQLNYIDAKLLVSENKCTVRRTNWGSCRVLRPGTEADYEFTNFNVVGLVVEDCNRTVCDCKVKIYQATKEDEGAVDWEVVL